jgi:hypothetical protein
LLTPYWSRLVKQAGEEILGSGHWKHSERMSGARIASQPRRDYFSFTRSPCVILCYSDCRQTGSSLIAGVMTVQIIQDKFSGATVSSAGRHSAETTRNRRDRRTIVDRLHR